MKRLSLLIVLCFCLSLLVGCIGGGNNEINYKNCGHNLSCIQNAIQNCIPAKATVQNTYVEVRGPNEYQCSLQGHDIGPCELCEVYFQTESEEAICNIPPLFHKYDMWEYMSLGNKYCKLSSRSGPIIDVGEMETAPKPPTEATPAPSTDNDRTGETPEETPEPYKVIHPECEVIPSDDWRAICDAAFEHNVSMCADMKYPASDNCYATLALVEDNPAYCNRAEVYTGTCFEWYMEMNIDKLDKTYCTEVAADKNTCLRRYGELKDDYSVCTDLKLDPSDDYLCWQKIAEANLDPSACSELVGKRRSECYERLAKLTKDTSLCSYMEEGDYKSHCYAYSSEGNPDPSVCANPMKYDYDRKKCYLQAARYLTDKSLCPYAEGEGSFTKGMCEEVVDAQILINKAVDKKDASICEEIQIDELLKDDTLWYYNNHMSPLKDDCYYAVAKATLNKTLCDFSGTHRLDCYEWMYKETLDPDICPIVKHPGQCYKYIGIRTNDFSLCANASKYGRAECYSKAIAASVLKTSKQ
ncbi:MAG: hypothetical protein J7K68_05035 [Candidatus Diapherotrites archaeon]|nr:hypothetical protein [Candidatus Diapherotrites archaeon]